MDTSQAGTTAAHHPADPVTGNLRDAALDALCTTGPNEKCQQVRALWAQAAQMALDPTATLTDSARAGAVPGRPVTPRLIEPSLVPQRSVHTPVGRAALLHAICHIEFNAINLALDAVWRFAGMPHAFYLDWMRVAAEEAYHFTILQELLHSMGHAYGDFDAHDGLWAMCEKTRDDVTARMALVPRTLEARGLDATPLIQAKLRKVGSPDALQAVALLDIILRDEVGHVAVGNRWYRWLCDRQGLDPVPHYRHLARLHSAPRLKPPFNDEARRRAGFSQLELDYLHGG